jgi:transmembrane sensor
LEGRVFFSIVHEPARPFIVLTNNFAVRALGTEFEVYKKREDKTTIAVSKGRVQVYQVDKNHGSNVRKGLPVAAVQPTAEQKFLARKSSGNILSSEGLGPGQEIVVYEQNAEYILKSFDLENSSTWLEGRLNFQNRPLPEVIEALNRYLINKIIVDDDLKDLNVSVYFEIKNRKEFVATLEKAFPVASRIAPNGQIVLFRRSQDRG